ncbi:MAG: glycosyltransferase [Candidatus Omnitrophota bacterium]|jgi:glycosyltransferase involved in cell wall biosynthesis|nr:MAG: glycosyltransferase [Candidatus Omnitrophota bacterium]
MKNSNNNERKSRILSVYNFLEERRGAQVTFINSAIFLRNQGHKVDVLVLSISKSFKDELESQGISVFDLRFKPGLLKVLFLNMLIKLCVNPVVFIKYRNFVKKHERCYDLALVQHSYFTPLILPSLTIPSVYFCHEPPRAFYEPNVINYNSGLSKIINFFIIFIEKIIDKWCVKSSSLILANSEYTREFIYRVYGLFAETCYLGVNINHFKPTSINKETMVLSVGALERTKAHDFILRSLSTIPVNKRPSLTIAGSGPFRERQRLSDMAKRTGVKLNILSVDSEGMVSLYNQAKATLIAGIMEPFGLAAIESMACQTPVVAVKEAGLRETIDESCGIFTNRDEHEFGRAVIDIIENPQLANILGSNGRKRVIERFTWYELAENFEKKIESILFKHFDYKRNTEPNIMATG